MLLSEIIHHSDIGHLYKLFLTSTGFLPAEDWALTSAE
jgi:hypothetical protein